MTSEKKEEKMKDAIALRNYIRNLKVCEARDISKRLASECKVPLHTFYNWRNGICRIPELAKDKIEEVAGITIFNR